MDEFDLDVIDESFNTRVRDSFNSTSTSTTNTVGVDVENVGNTDDSVNDSGNVDVSLEDVGNEDSHNAYVDVIDSGNDNSDNSVDESIDDSYNDFSDHIIDDSHNTATVSIMDDHSVNAGNREYNTGFGDISFGGMGAGGGGGDVWVDSDSTIIDQSTSGNVAAFGSVTGFSANYAVTASGEGSMAAGDDIEVSQTLNESTNILGGGDVNVGNSTEVTTVVASYNDVTDSSTTSVHTEDWDFDNVGNDYSDTYLVENAFNDELVSSTSSDWEVDADVIWGSEDVAIVDDVTVDADFDGA